MLALDVLRDFEHDCPGAVILGDGLVDVRARSKQSHMGAVGALLGFLVAPVLRCAIAASHRDGA